MSYDFAPRSLASLRVGETAHVQYILFDSVRDHCAQAGVREGSRVIGRGAQGSDVTLETGAGNLVVLNGVLARFVHVGTLPGEPRA
jgi:hypothetical protein